MPTRGCDGTYLFRRQGPQAWQGAAGPVRTLRSRAQTSSGRSRRYRIGRPESVRRFDSWAATYALSQIQTALYGPVHTRRSCGTHDGMSSTQPDAALDLVVVTLSVSRWADKAAGLAEIGRVMAPGATLMVADVSLDGRFPTLTVWSRHRKHGFAVDCRRRLSRPSR